MEASDELLTIAELAIGLAGFSGVIVAFTHRDGLSEVNRYHFIILFSVALSAVFMAFVPFGFHYQGKVGPALWVSSSLVMLIAGAAVSIALGVAARALPRGLRRGAGFPHRPSRGRGARTGPPPKSPRPSTRTLRRDRSLLSASPFQPGVQT